MTRILLTGVSGYIGGSIFSLLRQRKDFLITVLVRTEEQVQKLKELGADNIVIGSLDNSELLKQEASKVDVVINAADVDHLGCVKAIIEGLNNRAKQGGRKPFLLHTSGTDVLSDRKEQIGEPSSKVWTEAELGDINGIEKDRNHRKVDIEVLKAGESGTIDIAIICPPLIYGVGSGSFKTHSIQLPGLIQGAIVNKQAYHAGRGLNIWTHIHVLDLADLFLLVLGKALQGQAPVNQEGYYFAEAGEHNFLELTDEIAKVLYQKGVSQSPKSKDLLIGQNRSLNSNIIQATGYTSRGKSEKGKKMGWKPHRAGLLESVPEEVNYWLSQKQENFTFLPD